MCIGQILQILNCKRPARYEYWPKDNRFHRRHWAFAVTCGTKNKRRPYGRLFASNAAAALN